MTAARSKSILVVDDDEEQIMLIRLLLKRGGFTVHVADSAESAMIVAEREKPAIVVCDLNLPGTDGVSLGTRIRERFVENPPEIVLISASPEQLAQVGHFFTATNRRSP
jgi:CheY-like chemotaxis protein